MVSGTLLLIKYSKTNVLLVHGLVGSYMVSVTLLLIKYSKTKVLLVHGLAASLWSVGHYY
jgi:hypothetical protein